MPVVSSLDYDLSGNDEYRIASSPIVSQVSYSGSERLSVQRDGKSLHFDVRAHYVRSAPDGRNGAVARFVAEVLPDGTFEDQVDDDPDFLTVLNQPFAVQLDATTLRDVRTLHGAARFTALSPLGGNSELRGFLRPATGGPIDGHPSTAVRFEASGPMTGNLPGRSDVAVSGTMRMDGTAYYSLETGLLLALRATLTIDAHVRQGGGSPSLIPVRIVCRRFIRVAPAGRAIGQTFKMRR